MKKGFYAAVILFVTLLMYSCMSMNRGGVMATGGEVTGISGTAVSEPAPYGMVLVKRGSLKMGADSIDSLWGKKIPTREISVDAFWMDRNRGYQC